MARLVRSFAGFHREIDESGVWLPQVTELALRLDPPDDSLPYDLPLVLSEAVDHFKRHLPIDTPSPDKTRPIETLAGAGARAFVIDNLSYTYPDGTEALQEVSLSVTAGDFVALLGPNGAGKTTFAAHLVGILEPEPDSVRLFGLDASQLSIPELTARAGFVFQNPEHQFVTDRTDHELAYSLHARRRQRGKHLPSDTTSVDERVEELLELLDLTGLGPANPFTLSQGQKRRLSVGTMLAVGQRLLVLDEPTFGQDRRSTRKLMDTLQDLNRRGATIVMITHDMRLAAQYTRSAILLVDGKLVYSGPTRDLLLDQHLLEEAHLQAPHLSHLSEALRRIQYDFPDLMSVSDYTAAFARQGV